MDRSKFIRKSLSLVAVTGFCVLMVVPAYSVTYYVREDGGTAAQCTGLSDAPYPGSGNNQDCAFEHPSWAHAPVSSPTKLEGGDTLIIDGSNNAEYMIGFNAPNSVGTKDCHDAWPQNCHWRPIPSGPDPTNPTRILGKGWDTGCENPPQLWGNERIKRVIDMTGSDNVEIQCVEITDHSDCQEHGPNSCNRKNKPFGPWASVGLKATDSENVLLKNVNIHGIAHKGIHAGRLKDWTLEDTKIVANSIVGWDGDVGEFNSSNSGSIIFNRVSVRFNGCGETYPGKQPYNCYSQSQGGYGDGLGTALTGGNWIFNEVDFSHNVSDGLDLLYLDGTGTVTVKRSRFEGNAGNQIKISANSIVENSVIIGNCGFFSNGAYTWKTKGFNNCRAGGNSVVFSYHPNMVAELYNSTVTGSGDTIVMTGKRSGCVGTERLISSNNIFLGGPQHGSSDTTGLYYAAGSGLCANIKMEDDYSIIWATKQISTDCNGKENSMCKDPKLNQIVDKKYFGEAYDISLQSTSPAIDKGLVLAGKSSLDYKKNERGDVWDIGALEFNVAEEELTCADDIQHCLTTEECTAQGCYWYDDMCHVDPEPLPSCADDIFYCSTSSECEGQGYHWYNNVCNLLPEPEPTCADSILYCSNSTECVGQGYYWYNSSCHASPQPLPTCADGVQYCNNASDCSNQGYYWYDNQCHTQPEPEPTCADGLQYCLTSGECTSNGYYWYNNQCNVIPEPEPTCADGIQYCLTSVECRSNGYFWYDNACHVDPEPEPTCADDIRLCTKKSDCTSNGYYWYSNACYLIPEPTCADGIQYCLTSQDCNANGYHWYNNQCNAIPEPEPTCADGIQYCLTSTDCIIAGHYWYNNQCNAVPEPEPTCADGVQYCLASGECASNSYYWYNNQCNVIPEPEPTCADGVQYCLTLSDCNANGYHWYNNRCNTQPEPLPTCADGIQYCTKKSDCTKQNYFWYDNSCHVDPEPEPTCADGIQFCSKKSDCTSQGYHWYDKSCHVAPEPTCADGIQYCTKKSDCTKQGHFWFSGSCHIEPEQKEEQDSKSNKQSDASDDDKEESDDDEEQSSDLKVISDESKPDPIIPDETPVKPTEKLNDPAPNQPEEKPVVLNSSQTTNITEKSNNRGESSSGSGGSGGASSAGVSTGGQNAVPFGVGRSSNSRRSSKPKAVPSSGSSGSISGAVSTIGKTNNVGQGQKLGQNTKTVISDQASESKSNFTVTEITNPSILDLNGKTYPEMRKQLLDSLEESEKSEDQKEDQKEAEDDREEGEDEGEGEGENEGEGDGSGEGESQADDGEDSDGKEASESKVPGENEGGVQKVWNNILNWFSELGT